MAEEPANDSTANAPKIATDSTSNHTGDRDRRASTADPAAAPIASSAAAPKLTPVALTATTMMIHGARLTNAALFTASRLARAL